MGKHKTTTKSGGAEGGGDRKRGASSISAPQPAAKRLKEAPRDGNSGSTETDWLQTLPPELLLIVISNLAPRECRGLRQTCKALRDLVNSSAADTLTVTNDIAQYLVLEKVKLATGGHAMSDGWVAGLLAKFPKIKKLDVKCSQNVLTVFARHMVRDCLASVPPGAVPLQRIFDLAENVKTNSRRHSAVLLCELLKFKVAQSLTSKPPGYDALRSDVKQYVRADQLLVEHRGELQARVIELVEKVLTLKGHADARAHEHYKYARDTLDDSLLQLVACLQPRHSKYAYQLLAKAADPAKAARGWRWLFYFLARQKQAEAAIEAYKVVDKQALAVLSPTCLSELFRSLIDNEITTQPEPKLRAITSESGSWTKFLYRGNFNLTSSQSREGALEKVAADLIGKDYLDTAVNVMNRFESEGTAMEIWVQLLGALGIYPGGEMPLVSRELHRTVTEQVTKASALAMQSLPARRIACHVPLVELLVMEGHVEEAYTMVTNYPEQGALDRHLLRALSNAFALAECPPGELSAATCALLHDVLTHRLRDVGARSELTTILVAAYAARGELKKAVELASSLDAAAAAAMEADAVMAAAAAEPAPAPAAAPAGAPGAAGGAAAGAVAGAAGAAAGAGAGAAPAAADGAAGAAAAPGAAAAGAAGEAAADGSGSPAAQRLASMWRGVAAAAIRCGDAAALLTALPRVTTAWLLSPVDEAELGPEEAPRAARAAGASGAGTAAGAAAAQGSAGAGPSSAASAEGAAPGAAGGSDSSRGAVPMDATGPGAAPAAGAAAGAAGAGAAAATPVAAAGPGAAAPAGPCLVWQRVCSCMLRAGRRADLESACLQLLAERRRAAAPANTADQRALLECTARAMLGCGEVPEALALARRLGLGYPAPGSAAAGSAGGAGSDAESHALRGSRPCWAMLNLLLEHSLARGQLEAVVSELVAAGAAQARAVAAATTHGSAAGSSGSSASGLVLPAALGRPKQSLLADVIVALTEAGRPGDAVKLLRALRAGQHEEPAAFVLPPLLAPPMRHGVRCTRKGGAGAPKGRGRSPAALDDAGFSADSDLPVPLPATLNMVAHLLHDANPALQGSELPVRGVPPGPDAGGMVPPAASYNVLLLEGLGEEDGAGAGHATAGAAAAGAGAAAAGSRPASATNPCTGAGRGTSAFEGALAALVKALQKRAGASGAAAAASGSSAGAASGAATGTSDSGSEGAGRAAGATERRGGASSHGAAAASASESFLSDWLEVCKAWPPGAARELQLDALARRAMDKGRHLDVALQAGSLMADAGPADLKFAYTHRDLAQKCISQGMLEAAQACLMRIKPVHWEDAGDSTGRELMRAMARAGDKNNAVVLAYHWFPNEDQRKEFVKSLRSVRQGGGGAGGSRAGSSSRGSSRE